MHGQYVYYKFTISYDSNEQRLYNSNIDETKSNLRAAANSSSDGQSSLRMSSHIAESNINTGSDPYDPSDPLKNSIIMDLKPTVGDSDIFVACSLAATGDNAGTPSRLPGHFNFSSEHYSEDMISVSAMDPLNCARAGRSGVFYISIYGFSQIHSYYSFTVTKYGGVRTVIAGLPERGRVLSGLGAWYRFQLPDANAQEVTIIVTPILSDVDLYVKLGKTNPAHISNGILSSNDSSRYIGDGAYVPASRTSYDYKSGGIGTETETIILSERILAACAASHCWVSILVDSFSTAEYSLLVTLRDSTVQLIDSIPLYSSVAKVSCSFITLLFFLCKRMLASELSKMVIDKTGVEPFHPIDIRATMYQSFVTHRIWEYRCQLAIPYHDCMLIKLLQSVISHVTWR